MFTTQTTKEKIELVQAAKKAEFNLRKPPFVCRKSALLLL